MSVAALASSAARALNYHLRPDKPVIDGIVAKCHYRVTVAILFLCCTLCTAYHLIGTSIQCLVGDAFRGKENMINTYCWISSTFTLPTHYIKQVGTEVAAHGVGPYVPGEDERVYHNYYQWVPFVLFFQGLLFFAPHWYWKNCEGRLIERITEGLRGRFLDIDTSRLKRLVTYLVLSLHDHKIYALKYIFCEVLNLLTVMGTFILLNLLLGGQFSYYGWEVLKYFNTDQEDRTDPMMAIFPRMTKCTFHRYGSSGTIEQHDSLCILPLNIMNEKIFTVLWFWFYFLLFLNAVNILYLIFALFYAPIRKSIMEYRFKYKNPSGVAFLYRHLEFDDFALLWLLKQNLKDGKFQALLSEFYKQLCTLHGIEPEPDECLLAETEETQTTETSDTESSNQRVSSDEIRRSLIRSSGQELDVISEEEMLELQEIAAEFSTFPSTQRLLVIQAVPENQNP